ncbi:hypothetical protein [Sandaracinus amylolyticus]|uniref:Lipoprotein n=1 Tax=Sandaracinus amylolyticus TaxID=927083 RepID=A0A0F6W3Q4_9BACT|nr:hypothetical protein [Sandaracinus amylolyticus]AKF06668.1 hypothetical protein DB32_003817 [Sandaracinus amylolyticus]
MRLPLILALTMLAGCGGGQRSVLPDYSEWMHAGVDPRAEADAITAGLARAGYEAHARIEGEAWVAIDARRGEERAIRVVTSRGAALVLDSHEADRVRVRHGEIELVPPPRAPSHDLDGDGHDEIVVARVIEGRTCMLPFRIDAEGAIAPVPPDYGELADEHVCIESFRDVDGNERIEGIAVLRARALTRGDVPEVEVPLELDEHHRFRVGPPPVRWVEEQRRARDEELAAALQDADPERVYRIAIELAMLARVSGGDRDAQITAFDGAISRVVLTEAIARDVRIARDVIARSWDQPS